MASNEAYIRSEIKEIVVYLFLPIAILLLVTLVGFTLKGFQESFIKGQAIEFGSYLGTITIYYAFLFMAILYVIFAVAKLYSMKKGEHPAVKSNPSWFRLFTVSFLHSPEENGLLYYASEQSGLKGDKNLFRWMKNPLRLAMASIFLFGIFGALLISHPQWALANVPPASIQQVTGLSEVTFGSLLPAFAENGTILCWFSILMGIVAYICAKFKLCKENKWAFFGIGLLICIFVMSFSWASMHTLVYGNSGVAFWNTVIFGGLGAVLTLFSGSFIPFFIWHILNNLFLILSKTVTMKSDVLFITWILLILIFIIWAGRLFYKWKHRIKEGEYSIPEA